MGKFVITQRQDGEFQFNLKASNSQVILTSQGYAAKTSCLNGIESVRSNSADDARFDRQISANDKFFFTLKSTNGQVVGNSQMYESEATRDNGIESVKNNAPEATVDDETAA